MLKNNILFLIAFLFVGFSAVAQEEPEVGSAVGQKAPDIELEGVNGKTMKLSSLKGYLVLVDFWASWCGPCRQENPTVVKAYKTYSKMKLKGVKGFMIFSVSLDKNKEAWKQAIEKDGLEWKYHVSELDGWNSSAAKAYGVMAIPGNFLIDGNGIIQARNLRGDNLLMELEKWVDY